MPVSLCFVIPQTIPIIPQNHTLNRSQPHKSVHFIRSVYYSNMFELMKYHLEIEMSLSSNTGIVLTLDERYTNEVKSCDLDLSVEWFLLLLTKI